MSTPRRLVATLLIFVAFALGHAAPAASWDRDVDALAKRGLPNLTEVLTGRFARYPEEFYAKRLEFSVEEIDSDVRNYDAYDDAAVACFHIGRLSGAIKWMEDKASILDAAEAAGSDVSRERFRQLSNQAWLLARRWREAGSPSDNLADLIAARDALKRALEIDPNPPLGRERSELILLEWTIDANQPESRDATPTRLSERWEAAARAELNLPEGKLPDSHLARATESWLGLIATGDAWGSTDVFEAVAALLAARGDSNFQCLASLRCEELIDAGHGSAHPLAAEGEALKAIVGMAANADPKIEPLMRSALRIAYRDLRGSSAAWSRHREKYVLKGIEEGKHPDTHSRFWSEYAPISQVRWRKPEEASYGDSGLLVDLTAHNAFAELLEEEERRAAFHRLLFALGSCALFACGVVVAVLGGKKTRSARSIEAARRKKAR